MDLKGQGSVLGFLLCFCSYRGGLILLLLSAALRLATLLPQPQAHAILLSIGLRLFSAGLPPMIRDQTSPLLSVASLLDMSLSCFKPCKSLHVYN